MCVCVCVWGGGGRGSGPPGPPPALSLSKHKKLPYYWNETFFSCFDLHKKANCLVQPCSPKIRKLFAWNWIVVFPAKTRKELANTISPLLVHANWHAKYFSVTLTQLTLYSTGTYVSMYKICAVFEPFRHLLPHVGTKFNGAVTRRCCFHICRKLPYLQKATIFVKSAPINWNRVAPRCIITQTKQTTFGPLKHLKTVKIELYFSDRTLNHVSNGISRGKPCLRRQVLEENQFAIAIKILGRLFDVAALLIVSEIYLRSDRSSERCIYTSTHRTRRRWRRGNVTNPQLTGKLDYAVCFLTATRVTC